MTTQPSLDGARILVVGASAGIGRAFALSAAAMGARVCVSARRADRLEDLVAEMGSGSSVVADVTDPVSCTSLVTTANEHLGGFDLVLHTAGSARLLPLTATTAEVWQQTCAVNFIAPNLVCTAALPFMAPDGIMAFMSSESAHETRWGLAAYSSSKAGLDASINSWRVEHPERRFQRIVMGATFPTEFGDAFGEVLDEAIGRWMAAGVSMTAMDPADVGQHLAELYAVLLAHPQVDVPDLSLDPRGAPFSQ